MSAKYGLSAATYRSLFISDDGWRTIMFMSATKDQKLLLTNT